MELVYLWVEDYKNIKEEGFNFSPRFTCKYDKNSKKLTIDENKEYINIFSENINITAIVGENGSGKSSILESLTDVFLEYRKKWLDEEEYRKYILVYKYEGNHWYITKHLKEEVEVIDLDGNKITWIEQKTNDRLFESHSDLLALIIENETMHPKVFKDDKQIFAENIQDFNKNRIKKQILSNTIIDTDYKKETNKFFTPTKVKINIKWNNLFNEKKDANKYEKKVICKIKSLIEETKIKLKENKNKEAFLTVLDICDIKRNETKKASFFTVKYDGYIANYFDTQENYNCLAKTAGAYDIRECYKNEIEKLDKFKNLSFKVDEIVDNFKDFIFDLNDYIFDIELSDEEKKFEDLSFGERQLLTQLNIIQYYSTKKTSILYEVIEVFRDEEGIEHEIDNTFDEKVKNMIVLIDEFEIGLHPNWQKKAIGYIVDFLKPIRDINFHLILTSHSPFILSDLPKENVIFLKDGKQKDVNIETFGANIHTLLSHGFFMEDGLIGEFAKSKIDEAIKCLNQVKLSNEEIEYCENIIFIVGEPIIKRQLQKMLDSKRINYIADDVKDEIEFLKHRIDILSKRL